jgi:hypothetical protein
MLPFTRELFLLSFSMNIGNIYGKLPEADKVTGCREWLTSKNKKGYCTAHVNGKTQLIHRLIWESVHGPLLPGQVVRHTCDNPPCCEITHLLCGTHADNVADRMARGRGNSPKGETHSQAKLNEAAVTQLLEQYKTGRYTQKELSTIYGIGTSQVGRIVHGQRWRQIYRAAH